MRIIEPIYGLVSNDFGGLLKAHGPPESYWFTYGLRSYRE